MAQINIRMEDSVKEQGERLFNELGMNFSTAFNIFVRQALREGGMPFPITTKNSAKDSTKDSSDPFYSESNMAYLRKAIADLDAGKGVVHELIEVPE